MLRNALLAAAAIAIAASPAAAKLADGAKACGFLWDFCILLS